MKALPLAEALRACAALGYDGVELALMPGWPAEPARLAADARQELKKRLTDAGLALLGLMENMAEPADDATHRANLDRLKAAAELGHTLSPQNPPVIETILGGRPAQWDQVKERLAGRLRDWAGAAAAARTVVAVKPHVANALHTPEGARWLLAQVQSPWLKLAFDYSHFAPRGLPLAETVAKLVPASAFIHVKDVRGGAEKVEFLLPGEGGLDYAAYFRLLREAGYRGPVVVEVSGQVSGRPGYDPVAAARRCYANLAPALRRAGVRP
jgi:inosose dehydratase